MRNPCWGLSTGLTHSDLCFQTITWPGPLDNKAGEGPKLKKGRVEKMFLEKFKEEVARAHCIGVGSGVTVHTQTREIEIKISDVEE